jgi:intracellular sulfur oxidation DsrE/DsrF family protein
MRRQRLSGLLMANLLALVLLTCGTLVSAAEVEWSNPVIKGYGKIVPLPNAAMQPDKNAEYKIVFNLTAGGDPDKVNASLERVARAVNLFASAGVPQSRLNMVVIIHGTATPIVLDNAHYQEKFKLENPNIGLIDALGKAGVKVAVCGQALAGNKFAQEWVYPKVENTLSAITDVVILEKSGYVLFPL